MNRVVVTGVSAITPIGNTVDDSWAALKQGRSGIDQITAFDVSSSGVQIGGEVDLDGALGGRGGLSRSADSFTNLTCASVEDALAHSGLDTQSTRTGIVVGTGFGTFIKQEEFTYRTFVEKKRLGPSSIPSGMANVAASSAAIRSQLTGYNQTLFTACSAGTNAVGLAFRTIRHGYEDAMVAVGADATMTLGLLEAWASLRVVSLRNDDPAGASRPFSLGRDGFVWSMGAGALVLESYDHAIQRGAPILAEVAGYATNCDAQHMTAPQAERQTQVMTEVLADARVSPTDIDLISAHGTGTVANDHAETLAIKNVLGAHAYDVPVTALKSQLGHSIGAAGAFELIFAIRMMNEGLILPTINYNEPDPDCDLDYVPNTARSVDSIECVLKNSFGFGGNNAAVVLKRGA